MKTATTSAMLFLVATGEQMPKVRAKYINAHDVAGSRV